METKKASVPRGSEYFDYLYPKVSIVIPTFNSSQNIAKTLRHVLNESYPDFEVILVDAGSSDKTLEIVNSFFDPRIRICSVTTYQLYEMMNKGISLATGEYINFLSPGDYYLSVNTIKTIMDLAVEHDKPHLVYGASLLRHGISEPRVIKRDLSAKLLQKGLQPSAVQSMWFHKDLFRIIGKFKTKYKLRGELDLFCRFVLSPGLQAVATNHVMIDFELKPLKLKYVIIHFKETFSVVIHHFGFWKAFKWLFIQKDTVRILKLWLQGVRSAFTDVS